MFRPVLWPARRSRFGIPTRHGDGLSPSLAEGLSIIDWLVGELSKSAVLGSRRPHQAGPGYVGGLGHGLAPDQWQRHQPTDATMQPTPQMAGEMPSPAILRGVLSLADVAMVGRPPVACEVSPLDRHNATAAQQPSSLVLHPSLLEACGPHRRVRVSCVWTREVRACCSRQELGREGDHEVPWQG